MTENIDNSVDSSSGSPPTQSGNSVEKPKIENITSVQPLEPTQEFDKPIEIKRVESNEDLTSNPILVSEEPNTKGSKQPEPTKRPRKERSDKGKPRIIKHKKISESNFLNRHKVVKVSDVSKPKSNIGFKIGVSLGIIAGVFAAIFIYNKIRNGYFLKPKIVRKENNEPIDNTETPRSEIDRVNSIYGSGVKSDMD